MSIFGFSLTLILHQKVHGFGNIERAWDSDVLTITFHLAIALTLAALCFVKAKKATSEIS